MASQMTQHKSPPVPCFSDATSPAGLLREELPQSHRILSVSSQSVHRQITMRPNLYAHMSSSEAHEIRVCPSHLTASKPQPECSFTQPSSRSVAESCQVPWFLAGRFTRMRIPHGHCN